MQEFKLVPQIKLYDQMKEFIDQISFCESDLIFTGRRTYRKYFEHTSIPCHFIFSDDYLNGEPSDENLEMIYEDLSKISFTRVFGIGGGSILDLTKLLAIKGNYREQFVKEKELYLVPTTCGTGSEMTNLSILELKAEHTKMGIANDALYADYAVLIPELLDGIPLKIFATSSIDALIHAMESFTSKRATFFSKLFSKKAIELILEGYLEITKEKDQVIMNDYKNFLIGSAYAGIAFGNAGCAAVHALSYPLGAAFHIPHGESNYAVFTEVFKCYQNLHYADALLELNQMLSELLQCEMNEVYVCLDDLISKLLPKKRLQEYGMVAEDIQKFTTIVFEKQTRLMANNFTELTQEQVKEIYKNLL